MSSSLIIAIVVVAVGLWWVQKSIRRRSLVRRMGATLGNNLGFADRPTGKVTSQVRQKLLKLLGNNQATADRLIRQAKLRNPGEPEQWYWEKVLYDLERDRWR
jgi:hypothetical protein